MEKFGKVIVKLRIPILILSFLLLIPSAIGYFNTRVNYDILYYLPNEIETMQGQDILMDDFNKGAYAMVVVQNMDTKSTDRLIKKVENVDHVAQVISYTGIVGEDVPSEIVPSKFRKYFENDSTDTTLFAIFFDNTTSSDDTMNAIIQIREQTEGQAFISGMSAVVTDTKNLSEKETPLYVLIAVVLVCIVLAIFMDSFLVPVFFMISIGMAIVYNLGSNILLGEVSYITKALAAVLQLGVTLDYSIFLWHSYKEMKEIYPDDHKEAMAVAISNTLTSVVGSSITTVAGFIALCFMSFTLGLDLGIVMAKGVVIGVICCVTVLPSLVLFFDKAIDKTQHKLLLAHMDKPSAFITKHYKAWIVIFLVLLLPAIYGNNHTKIYYNIADSLPSTLDSNVANAELKKDFNMSNMHIVMMDKNMDSLDKQKMFDEIDKVKGVKWTISMNSLIGPSVPDSMIPKDIKKMLKSDNYELAFVGSEYESATDQVNAQIKKVDKIVKKYDKSGMVIGEAPLMKDLQDVTDTDLVRVNAISIAAIFIIIMVIFKSISLPIILVSVIEFAIMVNMAIPFYQGISLPFVASIVIGAIQLGATVDYAILMTTRYQKERQRGRDKMEAISIAHKTSMESIISSGLSFFAATFGVACYSKVEMIGSICTLLARGAIISMIVVLFVLPAMFMIFDKVICKTSIGFLDDKKMVGNDVYAAEAK